MAMLIILNINKKEVNGVDVKETNQSTLMVKHAIKVLVFL